MLPPRRRFSRLLAISGFAVIAALAIATFGFSPAQAHTTTAALTPNGAGAHTSWAGTFATVDETGSPDCSSGDSLISSTTGQRESVTIPLTSIPDDAVITSVDVQAYQRGNGSTGGTFQTFTRINAGSDVDSGTNVTVTSDSGCNLATQTINVADTVKSGATTLQIGVVKGNTTGVRVGALRAIVTYNTGPSAPTLVSPGDATTTQDRTPTFDWNDDSVDPNDLTGGTTTALIPISNGFYIDWGGEVDRIDETGTPSCSASDYLDADTTGRRDSFVVSLASIPDGTTITSVDVQAFHRGDGTAGGTFQTFTRLNGTDTDSGTNIATVGTADGPCTASTQTINVADTVKSGSTNLQIGVLKTAANTNKVRMGALRAVVTYTAPASSEGPFTYEINRAPFVSSACDWDNGTIDAVSGSTFTPGSTMAFGTHCWRVRALDHGNVAGPWSNHRTLTIEALDVTAEITAADKEYDGTTDAEYTCDVVGEEAGDDVTCDGLHPATFDTAGAGTGKTVTATGLTLGGADAGDYNLTNTTDTDTADITKKTLSVDADDKAKDYGDADPTLTYTLTGFVDGEDAMNAAGLSGAASCSRDAGESVAGSPYTITCTPDTLAADNYDFQAGDTGQLTIDKADPNCAITGFTGTYDGDPHGATGTCDGVNGEGPLAGLDLGNSFTNVPGGTANWTFTDQTGNYDDDSGTAEIVINEADPNCTIDGFTGTYDGDPHGATGTCDGVNGEGPLAGLDLGDSFTNVPGGTANWTFTDQTGNYDDDSGAVSIVINQATLSVDADDKSKDYGDADPTFTYTLSGFVDGEDETSAGVTGDASCTRDAGETVAGSPYTITCAPGTLAADNYAFQTGDTGQLTIGVGDVTAEITAADKEYDGDADADYTCEVVGAQSGDDVTCDGDHPASFDDTTAGTGKTVTATGLVLTGVDSGNYNLTNTADTDTADITKKTLSVDADDKSKNYGDADPTLTYTLSGFVTGEDALSASITGAGNCTRDAGESVAGSPYTITCTPGTLDAANYDFETGATGQLTIGTATLSVDADDKTKDFGDADPPLTYTLSGFASGEDENSAGVTGDADCSRESGESVGTYTITCAPGTLDAANYSFQTGATGTLTIEAADVTAEITASDKEYDGTTDAEYTCEVVGEQAGDDVTCDGTHPGTFDGANAGTGKTVTVTGLTLGGADAGSYTLTNTTDTDEADITKATLAVNADVKTKTYGDPDPTFTYTLSGFVAGENAMTAAGLSGAGECSRVPGESVAGSPYTITCNPGTLAADNYEFETGDTEDLFILNGLLSVDADDKAKDFGDADPALTYTLSGFAGGEDANSANVTGDASCSRDSGEAVGTYTITCAPGTLAADNYEFETGETGTLTIEAADVTAEITAVDKEYDGTTDASYTCEVVGEASGDDVTCDGTHPGAFDDANAGTAKTVTASGLTLGGADAGSYTLTNSTDTDEADITKATLSVDADDKTKNLGDADPAFTRSLSGFVAGEDENSANVTGDADCARDAGETAGTYTITCAPGTLDAANYDFQTGDTGTLTIEPDSSAPTVTINQASGQNDPTSVSPILFTVTFSESVTGFGDDDVELSGSAGATTANVSGSGDTYTVSVSGMSGDGTVTATVKAGAATDGTNTSEASTSTDNTVTFEGSSGLPPKHLDLETKSKTYAGTEIKVTIEKLAPGEEYTIKIDGEVVKTGTANSKGKVKTKVTVPLSLQPGVYEIQAIGSSPDREDTDKLRVRTPSDLDVKLRKSSISAGGTQRVGVDDLLRGEEVEVRYDGTLISPSGAVGDDDGEYTLTFPVGNTVGTHTVEVTGTYDGRSTTKTFRVSIDDD